MATVTTRITSTYSPGALWGYVLEVDVPTVVSADSRYYLVAPELRSESALFGVYLNIRKPVPNGTVVLPGQAGPALTYTKTATGFATQLVASTASLQERDSAISALEAIEQVYSSINPVLTETFTIP
jgi:hypothetical protein